MIVIVRKKAIPPSDSPIMAPVSLSDSLSVFPSIFAFVFPLMSRVVSGISTTSSFEGTVPLFLLSSMVGLVPSSG